MTMTTAGTRTAAAILDAMKDDSGNTILSGSLESALYGGAPSVVTGKTLPGANYG